MRPSPGAVLLALLPVLAAGCVGEPVPTAEPTSEEEATDLADLAMPDNRSGRFNAFEETNATEEGSGGMAHDHDYWLGRDRVELFRVRAMMDVRPGAGGAAAEFGMPKGALVFEGTARVEFLVDKPERHVCDPSGARWNAKNTCSDGSGFGTPELPRVPDPAPPRLRLQYIHASATEWIDAGELPWGAPLEVVVRPVETDMPHSTTSLWRFRVLSDQPALDSTLTFEAAATIVRGLDVPPWPAHPDFYATRSTRVVYDGPAMTRESGVGGDVFGFNDSLEQKTPGLLISYGTRTVVVHVNVTGVQAPPGLEPTHWYLYFHNATGDWHAADLFKKENTRDVTSLRFVLHATDDGMDSPYAPESRWEFVLRGTREFDLTAERVTCYGGCATYQADYHMTILATNLVLPKDAYSAITDA